MHPPNTTEGTTPIALAATPLSNCPNSLLLLINIEFTLITLPRISSGVCNCTMVPRITTLMPSKMPLMSNMLNDSQNSLDIPKMMIAIPKPATAIRSRLPWCFLNGNMVSSTTIMMAPISEAAFNQPKPTAPTFKMSLA